MGQTKKCRDAKQGRGRTYVVLICAGGTSVQQKIVKKQS